MIDLAISRAERTLGIIRLGFYPCGVAAVFGLAGAAIRTHFARPPEVSPVIDLAVLASFALGLSIYSRHIGVNLAKFKCLMHTPTIVGA